MMPQEKLKEIILRRDQTLVIGSWYEMPEDIDWMISRIKQLEKALSQCKVYSECYEELILTIDKALAGEQ